MVETRTVVVCAVGGVYWHANAEAAKCDDPTHDHPRFEMHRHRDEVVLPDGIVVTAVSFDSLDPYGRERVPDFGLYLDHQWDPPWPHAHLDWPDFGVPPHTATVVDALAGLHERARSGERVELGCHGGHGRTGTALAALAVLCGQPAQAAIGWVRAAYCDQAIETAAQEDFVATLGSAISR